MNIWDITPILIFSDNIIISVVILFSIGFFIGIIAAMFGIGGGFFFTPFYHSIIQLPVQIAVATSLGQIPFISLAGAIRFRKIIAYRFAGIFLVFALPASQVTAHFLGNIKNMSWASEIVYKHLTIPDLIILIFYSCTILFLGIFALFNKKTKLLEDSNHQFHNPQLTKDNLFITIVAGSFFGIISALLGVGVGFIAVPFFIYILKIPVKSAIGTSLFVIIIISVITSFHYFYLKQIYWGITLIATFGGSMGALLGSRFAIKSNPVLLQRIFGGFQILIVVIYLYIQLIYNDSR